MLGPLSIEQISALSHAGSSAEEISGALDIPLERVKLALAARNEGSAADRDIDDSQLALLRKNAFDLAMYAQDDSTKARMTMFLLERDKPRLQKEVPNNVIQINQAITTANARFDELLKEFGN